MILSYNDFVKKLNEKLFEGSYSDLLTKIVSSPDRYIGIFRPTKPKTKLIQNITQSHEIKFGDALENMFQDYFELLGFELLEKRLTSKETTDNKEYNIDQLFRKENTIYMIEQKVRDDHDSTKKVGQFSNFKAKYIEVSNKYKDNNIIPIMWFIDDSLRKNKNYYSKEMDKMSQSYNCEPKLYYGGEMFSGNENGIGDFPAEMWNEIIEYLTLWKKTLPDMANVDFDENSEEVFEEIKDLPPSTYVKLFKNDAIKEQILPILFTKGTVLKKLKVYFSSKENTTYKNIVSKIEEYLEEKFE